MTYDQEPLKALVVDDDRLARMIYRNYLLKIGYDVTEAEDGLTAIQIVSRNNNHFDVVLLDYNMPGENGDVVAEKIRRIEAEHCWGRGLIIGITAHTDPEIKNRCLQAGMDIVLSKPVRFLDLETLLKQLQSSVISMIDRQ